MLTQKELKKHLHYNPGTGIFTRLACSANNVKAGDIAGCLHNGYIEIRVNKKRYLAHRLAWFYVHGEWPEQIDHINHIRDDNRLFNLRDATNLENGKNQSKKITNTSGVTGVYWAKRNKKWIASVSINNKTKYLGSHIDKFEVICMRMSANNKYGFHKNHGKLNCNS